MAGCFSLKEVMQVRFLPPQLVFGKTTDMNEEKAKTYRALYAIDLRNLADKDYLSARANYKLGLTEQFLWAGLQGIEKYLKAILLFNDETTLELNHRIDKAFEKVLMLKGNKFEFSDGLREFIDYLNTYGVNRYWEFPSYTMGYELRDLDLAVWNIRRYCQQL